MKLLAVMAVLAVAGAACGQGLQTKTFTTTGHPTVAFATPDGKHLLVSVNRQDGQGGLDVFELNGEKLKRVAFQPLGNTGAQGIVLVPHTRVLAVGASNAGVIFLSLDEALTGKAKPQVLAQGEGSGSGYLAVSPDGQFLFVANEYGDGGNIGVVALHPDEAGHVRPEAVAHLLTPRATPGVAISADGSRVYTVGELVRPEVAARLPGHGEAELERSGCVQGRADRPMPNGVLYTIDAAKAEALTSASTEAERRAAVVSVVDAGCSPVRQVLSEDGASLYVTARGDDRVLVFGTKALESDPAHALLRVIPSGGSAPVGLALFDGGKKMLVANSNRFAGGPGSATVFDLKDPAKPVLLQTIRTGEFPRNVALSADGTTVFLTVFKADEVMVLRAK